MIALLRFAGLLNAAVWFGAAFFFVFIAEPGMGSSAMRQLLGERSFPYFSVAISQLIGGRFFTVFLVCGTVAMLHTGAEWLYFGKYPKRFWLLLIFGLFLGGLSQTYGLQPKLKECLLTEHSAGSRPEQREMAAQSYHSWHALSTALNVLLLGGLGVYLWRVANPPDEMRFVGAPGVHGKFRS
ncbi:MAG TPA: hypothetical protein VL793_11255 [Patescibacteria group bacterium]|nr:hypothetical protein [Patescibacteria group bacterium]